MHKLGKDAEKEEIPLSKYSCALLQTTLPTEQAQIRGRQLQRQLGGLWHRKKREKKISPPEGTPSPKHHQHGTPTTIQLAQPLNANRPPMQDLPSAQEHGIVLE